MPKRKTQEEFIAKAREVHGNWYDYSKSKYTNNRSEIEIICPKHGIFRQLSKSHLVGKGCPTCGFENSIGKRRLGSDKFINRSTLVHGNKYDYSKVNYVTNAIPVKIFCSKHGDFLQKPVIHLGGSGCPKCAIKSNHDKSRDNNFIERAIKIHGTKYDYSEVKYTNRHTKVSIICFLHGAFSQRPYCHLQGQGCPRCGDEIASKKRRFGKKEFIKKSTSIHGLKYDYSKIEYLRCDIPVTIICKKHGSFQQVPKNHFKGAGCPKCGLESRIQKRSLDESDFLERAIVIHESKYDYSKVRLNGSKTNIIIICPEHGSFRQKPFSHLQGHGCPKCAKNEKITQKEFDKRVQLIHGNKYVYQNDFVDRKTKIQIKCLKHGIFFQSPAAHLNGQGCPRCGNEIRVENQRLGKEEFVKRATELYGTKYDYSEVEYVNSTTKVSIICPERGRFWQAPRSHLNDIGCMDFTRKTTNEFIQEAKVVHGDKYSYLKTKYTTGVTPVIIICPRHGVFEQIPRVHLQGSGCPTCKESKGERAIRLYLESNHINYVSQYRFKKTIISKSRFDFKIFKGVIEYHGEQHYIPVNFGSKEKGFDVISLKRAIKRDFKKEQWCKKNNIPLLVIPYWDFDRIPESIDCFIKGENFISSDPPILVKKHERFRNQIISETVRNNSKP